MCLNGRETEDDECELKTNGKIWCELEKKENKLIIKRFGEGRMKKKVEGKRSKREKRSKKKEIRKKRL